MRRPLTRTRASIDELYNLVASGRGYATLVDAVQSQRDWYVDAVNGNDANPGTGALPLRTLEGLELKLGGGLPGQWLGVPSGTTITVHLVSADYSAQPTWQLRVNAREGGRVVVLCAQTVLHTGLLSGATNQNSATNTPYQITDSGALSWTPYVGLFVRLTSGPNTGARAVILKDQGAGVARCSEFTTAAFDNPSPAIGVVLAGNETYEILQPCQLPQINIVVDGPCYWSNATNGQFASLYIDGAQTLAPASGDAGYENTLSGNGVAWVQNSVLGGILYSSGGVFDTNNSYGGGGGGGGVVANGLPFYQIWTGGVPSTNTAHPLDVRSSAIFMDGNFVQNGADIHLQVASFVEIGSVGMFDGATWEIFCGSYLYFSDQGSSHLWGSSSAASTRLSGGAVAQYDPTYTFSIAGAAGGTFTMGGQTAIHTFRSDTGAFYGPVNLTFANLVAAYGSGGFNGHAIDSLVSDCAFVEFA